MSADALATEASLYLETIDLFRSVGLGVRWRPEPTCDAVAGSVRGGTRYYVADASDAPAIPS